ncbi:MAG: IS66 family insertion sequence element accessory protein TnpB [Spirochaetaceae bacterium]|nr:IS66 family insertion sequence element accessory protein TnpB [Spirochaetaceae bacterium]
MVSLPGARIVVATRPVDFRKGHDSLAAVVQNDLGLDPYSGVAFVFRSRRGDRLKVLWWDGTGLVLAYKRLERGGFAWPGIHDGVMRLSRAQFEALFEGLDWRRTWSAKVRRPRTAA